jgi:hypothetical protein
MSKVWQYSNDLILMSKCCDKWTYKVASSQVVEQIKFVHDPYWAACDVDLLDGDVVRLPLAFLWRPFCFIVPVILIVVIQ